MKTLTDLIFEVNNLGSVVQGSFTHKPLTIFCGPNNSGKTWTLYSLYHFYQHLQRIQRRKRIQERRSKEKSHMGLDEFNERISYTLEEFFNTSSEQFKTARFHLILKEKKDWHCVIDSADDVDIFLMPAERNGLHLFFRELSTKRTALLHHASRDNIDISELLHDVMRSRYAIPIANYIDWLNELTDKVESKSEGFRLYADRLKKSIAGGAYKVDVQTGRIAFKPYQKKGGRKTTAMGLHMTSSTVKSLFGLWFYLEHQARTGSILMIDEPELNIHPDNQRKIARLLARLVNAGLRVIISTHSDYIVREFNSLIMLNRDKSGKLRRKHRYSEDEVLRSEQVGAYLFDKHVIEPFEISPEDGIYATTFNEVIDDMNKTNNDIYYSLQEQKDER